MTREQKWAEAIEQAKSVLKYKDINQMEVAKLAISVCEIFWGGTKLASGEEEEERYTLTRFAGECKIHRKTLSQWVAVYKNVYEKLPPFKQNNLTYSQLSWAAKCLNAQDTKDKVEKFVDKVSVNTSDRTALHYLREFKSMLNLLEEKSGVLTIEKDVLQEILYYVNKIQKVIKKEHPKLTPETHGYSCRARTTVQAAASFGIRNITIKPKDLKILEYMRNKKYCSPHHMGKAFGQSDNASSAWSLRTLYKLSAGKFVKKNTKGHYALTAKAVKFLESR